MPTQEELYVRDLNAATSELQTLSVLTAAPASMQFRYVGTVVDNTLLLVAGLATALDHQHRDVQLPDFETARSAMKAMHRAFHITVVMAVEQGLREVCDQDGIPVEVNRQQRLESLITTIEADNCALSEKTRHSLGALVGQTPDFMDYVRAIIAARISPVQRQKVWRMFFDALSIVRNKSSHSDTTLSASDQRRLADGGLGALTVSGELQTNPRRYKEIVDLILQFYREAGLAAEQTAP